MSLFQSVLCVDENLLDFMKKSNNKTDENITQDVAILSEWCRQQAHFPKAIDDHWLTRILIRNKFRLEQTKKKLEAYFTLRAIHKEMFSLDEFHPKSDSFKKIMKSVLLYPSLKNTNEGYRIHIFKFDDPNPDLYDFRLLIKWAYIVGEILCNFDFALGDRLVCDVSNLHMRHVVKLNLNDLVQILALWQKGFSGSLRAINLINASSFVNLFTRVVAPLLKKGKIIFHDSLKVVPRENLPEELGGTEGKAKELRDAWISEVEKNWDYILFRSKQISDESLRIGKSHYDDIFGVTGTFKAINID